MITDIEDYFNKGCGRCARFDTPDCAALLWREGLAQLRVICQRAGLEETLKWGHPCFTHNGRNVAILGAFRDDYRISFFEAGLLSDPEELLEKSGPNTAHADMIRFGRGPLPMDMEHVLSTYLAEAKSNAAEGRKMPKADSELVLPTELTEALNADARLAAAFSALTPGRQRSYVIALSNAKQSETRKRRIVKFRPKILAGKGAQERD